jgi:hypothetical protein
VYKSKVRLNVKKDNHFLPRMYLKNWCNEDGKVLQYKNLVPHENVPFWKCFYPAAVGYSHYLYVDTKAGHANDALEEWFDIQFESPAKSAISKVIVNTKLTKSDYVKLINFVAAQDVRTPKRYFEHMERSNQSALNKIVENVVREGKCKIPPDFKPDGIPCYHNEQPIKIVIEEDADKLIVKASRLSGRASWLWSIKHVLTTVAEELHKNRWTILHPADGMNWITSDNPVLRLNYNNESNYNFNGGWRNEGSEIMLPLGPRHLLYTQVGKSSLLLRGTKLSAKQTLGINRLIAENSYRFVISNKPVEDIQTFTPRTVDKQKVDQEKENWDNWNNNHMVAESSFYGEQMLDKGVKSDA